MSCELGFSLLFIKYNIPFFTINGFIYYHCVEIDGYCADNIVT